MTINLPTLNNAYPSFNKLGQTNVNNLKGTVSDTYPDNIVIYLQSIIHTLQNHSQ